MSRKSAIFVYTLISFMICGVGVFTTVDCIISLNLYSNNYVEPAEQHVIGTTPAYIQSGIFGFQLQKGFYDATSGCFGTITGSFMRTSKKYSLKVKHWSGDYTSIDTECTGMNVLSAIDSKKTACYAVTAVFVFAFVVIFASLNIWCDGWTQCKLKQKKAPIRRTKEKPKVYASFI
ncbi:Hypothetical_protein [Hexamita inflata]|uniref:Hypothetical_protein n=1 Tax=Hexamita inflata TaxID=28002 RepID=A0AA86U0M7_9EUKA|nr:Hypothetical protein HINF_LOCUS21647 [Hexamita inflata]